MAETPTDYSKLAVDALVNSLLTLSTDDHDRWTQLFALQSRGTREVFDRGVALASSACPHERQLAADLIGKLGGEERPFQEEALATLWAMHAVETTSEVLCSLLPALGHRAPEAALDLALRHADHPDADVRWHVVHLATGDASPAAIALLIRLSSDEAADVRDWATFGLGTQIDSDTPEIRSALLARVEDDDFDTASEALVGLAVRGDRRVLPALERALAAEDVGTLAVEAARDIGSPQLYEKLITVNDWWDVDSGLLDEAIEACRPLTDLDP